MHTFLGCQGIFSQLRLSDAFGPLSDGICHSPMFHSSRHDAGKMPLLLGEVCSKKVSGLASENHMTIQVGVGLWSWVDVGAESSFLLGQKFINLATLYTCWCGPESQKLQKLQSIRTSFVFFGFRHFLPTFLCFLLDVFPWKCQRALAQTRPGTRLWGEGAAGFWKQRTPPLCLQKKYGRFQEKKQIII